MTWGDTSERLIAAIKADAAAAAAVAAALQLPTPEARSSFPPQARGDVEALRRDWARGDVEALRRDWARGAKHSEHTECLLRFSHNLAATPDLCLLAGVCLCLTCH